MCLAVPGKLIERDGESGLVELHGNRVPVSVVLTPEAALGDWVLVHAGFAISSLSEAEAMETFALLGELEEAGKSDE